MDEEERSISRAESLVQWGWSATNCRSIEVLSSGTTTCTDSLLQFHEVAVKGLGAKFDILAMVAGRSITSMAPRDRGLV